MTKWEFMRKLEELLFDISPTEREEALQYYNDYINDAGKENEAEAMASLGTPEQVAEIVKEGLEGNSAGMFTEKGYQGQQTRAEHSITRYSENDNDQNGQSAQQAAAGNVPEKKNKMSGGLIALLVVLCIFASPLLLGVAGTAFGLLIAVIAVVFSIFLVIAVMTIVLFVVAITLIIWGFTAIVAIPMLGIGLIGSGCVIFSIAVLCLLAVIALFGTVLPALFRGIVSLFHRIFHRRGGAIA